MSIQLHSYQNASICFEGLKCVLSLGMVCKPSAFKGIAMHCWGHAWEQTATPQHSWMPQDHRPSVTGISCLKASVKPH